MTKKDQLIQLRPTLPDTILEGTLSDTERFQNQSLRPVIKLQNDTLVILTHTQMSQLNKGFKNLNQEQKTIQIESLFDKNTRFKSLLIGTIIGMFTAEELEIFLSNKSEFSRRIIGMVKERVLPQVVG